MFSVIHIRKAGKIKSVCWFSAQMQVFLSLAQQLGSQYSDELHLLLYEKKALGSQNRLNLLDIIEGGEHN
jgi:hypothetical protein